jgi:hypothetical protein
MGLENGRGRVDVYVDMNIDSFFGVGLDVFTLF